VAQYGQYLRRGLLHLANRRAPLQPIGVLATAGAPAGDTTPVVEEVST
jgi:hypothetical protein